MPGLKHALWIAVIALVAVAIANRVAFLRRLIGPVGTSAAAPSTVGV